MYNRGKVIWSPCEEVWLKENKDRVSIDQCTIHLAKSRTSVIKKIRELEGKSLPTKKQKKLTIGKRKDLGGLFVRSGWEGNIIRYLNFIGKKWIYEPSTFFFNGEKRGAISYMPDIYLPEDDIYIEIKGFLTSQGRSSIRKFKKYYPTEFFKLQAITGSIGTKATQFFNKMNIPIYAYYSDLNKEYKNIIEHWE